MKLIAVSAFLFTFHLDAALTYGLRDARLFGETSARETTQLGAFNGATAEQLPVNFTTGGPTPTLFNALSTTQGSPFLLTASNHVNAAANTALTFNTDFVTPTSIVSLVQSRIFETNVTITGGSGVAYLLPTFRVVGSFEDTHPGAYGDIHICAGVDSCALDGVANSTGPANVDTLYTPDIGSATDFTFGTPFTFFFFLGTGISSFTNGNLAPGEVNVNANLEFAGIKVVDENGNVIRGAQINSAFIDLVNTPEPGTFGMMLAAALGVLAWRKR